MNNTIASKIESIFAIFQIAQESASTIEDVNELIKKLEETPIEFLSVAYEGAAMELALRDFSEGDKIDNWKALLEKSKKHACQIYIGMGWAIAKEKRFPITFLEQINYNMQYRIWDGCGYYDGIFRQRHVIRGQNRFEYIEQKNYQAYDEGLGRSLWYLGKGDVTKATEMVYSFSSERQSDLWRGIGIACSYVGGFDEQILNALISSAGQHSTQLGIGAAMVAKSRIDAGCLTNEIELACSVFNQLSAEEAMEITIKNKTVPNFSFSNFILQMEKDLKK